MICMWTNGADYVIAPTVGRARAEVIEQGGLSEEDALPASEWHKVPESAIWTLVDEDTGDRENISVCAIVARHVALNGEVVLYQWSSEW